MSHFATQQRSQFGNPVRGAAALATARTGAVSIEPDAASSEAPAWLASRPMPRCGGSMAQPAPGPADPIAAVWSEVSLASRRLVKLLVGDAASGRSSAVTGGLRRANECHQRDRAQDAPDTTWELPVASLQSLSSDNALEGQS
jgi:hypothetical protein